MLISGFYDGMKYFDLMTHSIVNEKLSSLLFSQFIVVGMHIISVQQFRAQLERKLTQNKKPFCKGAHASYHVPT